MYIPGVHWRLQSCRLIFRTFDSMCGLPSLWSVITVMVWMLWILWTFAWLVVIITNDDSICFLIVDHGWPISRLEHCPLNIQAI